MEAIFKGEYSLLGRLVLRWNRSLWEKRLSKGRVLMEERFSWVRDPHEVRVLKGKRSS